MVVCFCAVANGTEAAPDGAVVPAAAAAAEGGVPAAAAAGDGAAAPAAPPAAAAAAAGAEDGETKEPEKEDAYLLAALAVVCGEEIKIDSDEELETRLGQLDVALTWLWRVHGVDFYGGRELLRRGDYDARLSKKRTLRGPRPEEGEQQDEAESEWRQGGGEEGWYRRGV